MAIILVSPEFTQEQYEETVRKLTGGKSKLESPADWPVEGLLVHVAGQGEGTLRVVDVWESEEALNRFAEVIIPIIREAGVEGDPEVYPAHTFISAYPLASPCAPHEAPARVGRSTLVAWRI